MLNKIREIRKERGLSQSQVAEHLTKSLGKKTDRVYSKDYISKLERNDRALKQDVMIEIAEVLGCSPLDLADKGESFFVDVIGEITDYGDVSLLSGKECEKVDAPTGARGKEVRALRVKGDGMPPFKDGWLLFVEQLPDSAKENYADCINCLCLVSLESGKHLIREVRRGYSDGLWNLFSYQLPQLEDVALTSCDKIIDIRPV